MNQNQIKQLIELKPEGFSYKDNELHAKGLFIFLDDEIQRGSMLWQHFLTRCIEAVNKSGNGEIHMYNDGFLVGIGEESEFFKLCDYSSIDKAKEAALIHYLDNH